MLCRTTGEFRVADRQDFRALLCPISVTDDVLLLSGDLSLMFTIILRSTILLYRVAGARKTN